MNEKDVLNEPKTYFQEVVEHISVKRKERLNNAVFGEIKQIAREHDIFTTVELNERAIVQALEKHIPKKPVIPFDSIRQEYECPKCIHWVYKTQRYCDKCGQALDWSDENEE